MPLTLRPGLPEAGQAGRELVARVAVLKGTRAAISVALALRPMLSPAQRGVGLLPGLPVCAGVRGLVQAHRDLFLPEVDQGGRLERKGREPDGPCDLVGGGVAEVVHAHGGRPPPGRERPPSYPP